MNKLKNAYELVIAHIDQEIDRRISEGTNYKDEMETLSDTKLKLESKLSTIKYRLDAMGGK